MRSLLTVREAAERLRVAPATVYPEVCSFTGDDKMEAERLRVAPATVYLLCEQGRLTHLRVGAGGRGIIRVREEIFRVSWRRL